MEGQVLIRGGLLLDGTGGPAREADVEIVDGRIARVGRGIAPGAHEVVDARGRLVTPGFVDVHTHFDGHVSWDTSLAPTSMHGVTTAVMGNCGVGFAPCRPEHRDALVELMEAIEDIPAQTLALGLKWNWRTFPEYLDALDAQRYDIDVAAQLPHGALRLNVMGERGARREKPTAEDLQEFARLAGEAVRAGAIGFSSSRIRAHRTRGGEFTPDYLAPEEELQAIAAALAAEGRGVLQFATDIQDQPVEGVAEFRMLRRLVERSGRPMSMSITQREADPDGWKRLLGMIGEAARDGLPIRGQVMGRGIGLVLGWELTDHPFTGHPAYREIAGLPFDERLRRLSDPGMRARLLSEQDRDPAHARRVATWERLFEIGDDPDYEPPVEASIGARAARLGIAPAALAYDTMMGRGGRGLLYRPLLNYAHGNLQSVYEMLTDPNAIPGLSDGGAHCGTTCDSSITTFDLAYWTRDRAPERGPRLPLPKVIHDHTARAAAAIGLHDRGIVAPGMRGDLNVIDYDRLRLYPVRVVHDMPGGGRRLVQPARGYVATLVAGVPIVRDDEHTGARPGRLVRGRA